MLGNIVYMLILYLLLHLNMFNCHVYNCYQINSINHAGYAISGIGPQMSDNMVM